MNPDSLVREQTITDYLLDVRSLRPGKRARSNRPPEKISLTIPNPQLCTRFGSGAVLDPFQDHFTAEVFGNPEDVGDDLDLRRVTLEQRAEVLADLEKVRSNPVDEGEVRVRDSEVVKSETYSHAPQVLDLTEDRLVILEGSLFRDLENELTF